ncbi:MarR family winged helix-turn-helix transcriptional regulator [Acidimangrovimonas sediminis]|uniref:MarR family winged helix-turn-helix transcriptional regulator n=1 Tax=Acidimangrovimonas sediminis TaxID=2056283 RepID=UPI0013049301|nr:MarR family transcriptional regulator [Acidimangrovimonas sediminis]
MQDDTTETRREFVEALVRVGRKVRTLFNGRVTAHGLTYARARALRWLADHPEGLTQKALACILELEQPTTGRLLDTMEGLGLVSRVPDPNDRRANLILLTELGAQQAELVAHEGEALRRDLLETFDGAELEAAIDLLCRISEQADVLGARAGAHPGGDDETA